MLKINLASKSMLAIISMYFLSSSAANSQDLSEVQKKISELMNSEYRSQEEINRDSDRDPIAAVDFMGIQDNMTVIEFFSSLKSQLHCVSAILPVDKMM